MIDQIETFFKTPVNEAQLLATRDIIYRDQSSKHIFFVSPYLKCDY